MRVPGFTAEATAAAFVAFMGQLYPDLMLAVVRQATLQLDFDRSATGQSAMACRHQRQGYRQVRAFLSRIQQ